MNITHTERQITACVLTLLCQFTKMYIAQTVPATGRLKDVVDYTMAWASCLHSNAQHYHSDNPPRPHLPHQPPSHSTQLGCAGGLWNLKVERARVSLYCRKESSSSANISSFKRDLQRSTSGACD